MGSNSTDAVPSAPPRYPPPPAMYGQGMQMMQGMGYAPPPQMGYGNPYAAQPYPAAPYGYNPYAGTPGYAPPYPGYGAGYGWPQ